MDKVHTRPPLPAFGQFIFGKEGKSIPVQVQKQQNMEGRFTEIYFVCAYYDFEKELWELVEGEKGLKLIFMFNAIDELKRRFGEDVENYKVEVVKVNKMTSKKKSLFCSLVGRM